MVKRFPYLFVGWLWYAITILPVIGIIKISSFAMADRYYYLPSIGIAVMLAWGIPPLIKSENMRKNILLPAGIAFFAIMTVLSWQQCRHWKNSIELSNQALRVTKDNDVAHSILAYALFGEGKIEEAIEHANEAIRLNHNNDKAYEDRGVFYFKLGKYQRAIENVNEAVRLKTDYAPRYYLRGNMYNNLGQYQRAIKDYNEAIRLKQDYADAYNERGGAYLKLGQYQLSIKDYDEAIRLKQDYADAYNNRAFVYFNQEKKELGCGDAQKGCELGNCKILEGAKIRGYCH
jgi:tetratricopeptide (TPR) repeat protein